MDKEEMDIIKDLAILNYVEIQHLKKLLCDHFGIKDRVGLYNENLEKYLDEREQRGEVLIKEIKARRKS
jgi:hypothetical protein